MNNELVESPTEFVMCHSYLLLFESFGYFGLHHFSCTDHDACELLSSNFSSFDDFRWHFPDVRLFYSQDSENFYIVQECSVAVLLEVICTQRVLSEQSKNHKTYNRSGEFILASFSSSHSLGSVPALFTASAWF